MEVRNARIEKLEAEQVKQLEVVKSMALQGRSDKEIGTAIGKNPNAVALIRGFLGLYKSGWGHAKSYAEVRNLVKEADNCISVGRINLNRLQKDFDCDKLLGIDSSNMDKFGWHVVEVDGNKIVVEVVKR